MYDSTTFALSRTPLPVRVLNGCGEFLESAGFNRTAFDAESLIEEAKRRSGLAEFGAGEIREPLRRLLRSCFEEARLNLVGRLALRSDVVQTLCNRLRIERDRAAVSEIRVQRIVEPIVIIGLPRTGTTLLHTLLALDPDNRAPLTWEVMDPPSLVQSEGDQAHIRRTARNLQYLNWLAPKFRNVHAVGALLPQECLGIMSYAFMSDQFDTMYNVPSYQAWLESQDLSPAYEFHHRFLQHLQVRDGEKRWILKAPTHMFSARELLTVYPEARIIQTHRAPMEVIASVASLMTILRSVFSNSVDPFVIGRQMADYWSGALNRFMHHRESIPSERIADLHFTEIQRDPMAAVRRIYEQFEMELSGEAESRMRDYLARQPAEQHGCHRYELGQFGLSAEAEAPRFEAYCERFCLPGRQLAATLNAR